MKDGYHKFRIVLEVMGEDEDDALDTAGHYLNIGYKNRVLVSITDLDAEVDGI